MTFLLCLYLGHFYAMKLNISKENLTVETLKEMVSLF